MPRQITSCRGRGIGESRVTAVSSVIALNTDSYAPELQDLDSFKAYLAGLNIREESYFVGNELTSQANQILERDRQLGGTALMDHLIEWLNENQNPETGHWDYKKPGDDGYDAYYGVNGLLKISGIYTSAKKVIPNAKAAARSAMVAITDLQQIDAGVDLYNTWFAIRNIIENLRKFGGAEGNLMADEIVFELREDASRAVIVSRDKIKDFIKPDGSASYSREFSAPYSQGCPAAVPNSREGDVNGNVIASIGIITYALGALELLNYRVPLFGDVERRIFLDTIENLSPVNKVEDVTVPDPIDFDYDTTGEPSEDIILKLGDGSANVIDDPRGSGKVTAIVSPSGKGDAIRIANNTTSALATTSVFEGDFCLVGSDVEYSVQVYMDALYMFIFRVKGDKVHIHEVSSSTSANGNEEDLGIVAKVGEWFSIKVEHYAGDHSSVRIKVFADTDLSDGKDLTLYAVSDNYYDASGTKFLKPEGGKPSKTYTHTEIYVMAKPSVTMYVDNLNSYKSKTPYTEVIDPNGQPFFNVDAPDRAEKLYSFDGGVLPSELILESSADTVAVKDSMLALGIGSGESAVSLPINVRTKASRCAKVSFDIICPDAAVGKSLLSVFYRDGGERMLGLELAVKLEGAEKFVGIKTLGKESGDFLADVRIDIGKKTNVRIEYFHAEDIALIYIDGVFVASGANIYEGAYKMTSDRVEFFSSGANLVSLDNITFEKVNRSFTDAVLPTIPSKVYDFESTHSELKTVGTGVKYSGGALEMNSERASVSLDVPINKRAPIYTSILFEATLSYSSLKNDGTLSLISFKDKDGNAVASLALRKNGSKVELCEVGADGPLPLALLSYGISEKIKLTLELFPKEKMTHIYENGAVVAKTSIFVGIDNLDAEIITASVQSGEESSVLRLDDLKFERLYSIYSNKSVTTKGNEEKTLSEPMTFEYSNSGNLPSVVTWGLAGSASAIRVERFEDKDGKQTNALSFYTAPGSNDMLVYTASESLDSYKCVAFEADIMLDIRTEGQTTCYQMYFSSKDSRDKVYFLQLYKDGESFSLIDKSDTNNNSETKTDTLKTGIPHREWFKLRIEYYRGDANTVSFKIYLDGELCCESDNFFGSQVSSVSPASRVECFYFYSLNKCDGTIYMDNVRLYGFN